MGRRGLSLASVLGTPTFPERCFGSASGSAQHDNRGGEVPACAGTTGRYFHKNDGIPGRQPVIAAGPSPVECSPEPSLPPPLCSPEPSPSLPSLCSPEPSLPLLPCPSSVP